MVNEVLESMILPYRGASGLPIYKTAKIAIYT